MNVEAPLNTLAVLGGLGIGAVIGAAAFWSNFCALGAVADILFARDWRRMRCWILAAGVALLGTQALDAAGLIHLGSILAPNILWLPAAIGGICFGYGMALAGGCINRALVRIGAGSLKALFTVLVVGLMALMTGTLLASPLQSLARVGSVDVLVAPETIDRLMGALPHVPPDLVRGLVVVLVGGAALVFALKDGWFRKSRDQVIAGLVIGAAIPAAWAVTQAAGVPEPLNFAAPAGDLLLALVHEETVTFGVAVLVGVPVGAFVVALLTRNLARETFLDAGDFGRHLAGGLLMGFGGVLAMGCTFGQGLSGLSTLSVTSVIAVAGIIAGCLWGIRTFEAGSVWGGLKLAFSRGV